MDHGFSSYFPHFAMARTCRDFLPHFQTHPQTWHRSRMCSAKGQFWQPSKSWTPWTCGENESCLACRKNMIFFILSGDSQKRTCGHWLYGLYGLQLNVAHLLAPFRILQHPSFSLRPQPSSVLSRPLLLLLFVGSVERSAEKTTAKSLPILRNQPLGLPSFNLGFWWGSRYTFISAHEGSQKHGYHFHLQIVEQN